MKALLGFLAVLAALGVMLFLFSTPVEFEALPSRGSSGTAARPAAATPPATVDASELRILREQLALLEGRVAELGRSLEALRSDLQRRPAELERAGVAGAEELLAAAGQPGPNGEFTDAQREAIATILEQAREREAELRAEERAQREEQLIQDRAGRIADKLMLPPADRTLLADHLRVESEKRRAIIDSARDPGFDRELLRDEFVALRDWSEAHLIEVFGPGLAGQIRVAERESRGSTLDGRRPDFGGPLGGEGR